MQGMHAIRPAMQVAFTHLSISCVPNKATTVTLSITGSFEWYVRVKMI